MEQYEITEIVREYQIRERDYVAARDTMFAAKEKLDKAKQELHGYVHEKQSVAAQNLDGDLVFYFSDEDGDFHERTIGQVIVAGQLVHDETEMARKAKTAQNSPSNRFQLSDWDTFQIAEDNEDGA